MLARRRILTPSPGAAPLEREEHETVLPRALQTCQVWEH